MFDDVPLIALRAERGVDVFERRDEEAQRRAVYRCVATLGAKGLVVHLPDAGHAVETLRAAADGVQARVVALDDSADWSDLPAHGAVEAFLRLDFLRAWLVADLSTRRFEAALTADPASLPMEAGKLSGAVEPAFNFNRLARGVNLAHLMLPTLESRIAVPGFVQRDAGSTGYALRMLGDLCLRADEAALALRCFEASCATGDNSFRRRRAIEAARALGHAEALLHHRAAYAARWTLPPDLAEHPAPETA